MEITNEILPEELLETFNSLEFDDEAGILIEMVEFTEGDLSFTFSIRFYNNIPKQLWSVTIKDVEEEKISRELTAYIKAYNEHVLLLEFNDIATELYFKGTTDNADALFIDIFQSIHQLSDDSNYISKYILSSDSVNRLSKQGHGLFARGPKTVLNLYADCLSRQGIKPIFIGEYRSTKSLKLLILGNSYFIGQDFFFKRKEFLDASFER